MGILNIFAANMRKYRKARKLTQEELAKRCGLHRTYIGGIEQGRINVSLKNVEKIAQTLEIDPVLLFLPSENNECTVSIAKRPQSMAVGDIALCKLSEEGLIVQPVNIAEAISERIEEIVNH